MTDELIINLAPTGMVPTRADSHPRAERFSSRSIASR